MSNRISSVPALAQTFRSKLGLAEALPPIVRRAKVSIMAIDHNGEVGGPILTAQLNEIVKNVIPDAVIGILTLAPEVIESAPPHVMELLDHYTNWSVLVYALPIKDQTLWVWHKHGEHRSLFANYILGVASTAIREALSDRGIASVDIPQAFDGRVSLIELGERAGLGTRGINDLLLHPEHGSWLQLHALLIDHDLANSKSFDYQVCIKCMKCVKACPAHALEADEFHAGRCARLVASFWNPRSRAVALTESSYIECAECILSCPIGEIPAGIFEWKRGLQ